MTSMTSYDDDMRAIAHAYIERCEVTFEEHQSHNQQRSESATEDPLDRAIAMGKIGRRGSQHSA